MSGHTPGPWKLETVRTQIGKCHKIGPFPTGNPAKPETSACVYVDGLGRHENPELLANARLIAAAPELLEACKVLLPEGWDDGTMDHMPGVKQAREAIAKAQRR